MGTRTILPSRRTAPPSANPASIVRAVPGESPPPLVNASRAPGQWQTYDVIWEGPHWDAASNLVKKAYVTVIHNGVVVHHRRELHGFVNHRTVGDYKKVQEKGPIELYEHGNPVRFRNIWIRPLGEYDKP